jgi:hypothetical protein
MKGEIKKPTINNEEYLVTELEKVFNEYLSL